MNDVLTFVFAFGVFLNVSAAFFSCLQAIRKRKGVRVPAPKWVGVAIDEVTIAALFGLLLINHLS